MNISDNDIIRSAQTLRAQQNQTLRVPQNPMQRSSRSHGLWWAAAACVACFVAGLTMPRTSVETPSTPGPIVEKEAEPVRVETKVFVHDTIYLTRVVTKEVRVEVPAVAENTVSEPEDFGGCSALCDNIDYNLLATK